MTLLVALVFDFMLATPLAASRLRHATFAVMDRSDRLQVVTMVLVIEGNVVVFAIANFDVKMQRSEKRDSVLGVRSQPDSVCNAASTIVPSQ